MIRFPFLEQFGVDALMSDRADGDCRTREGAESFLRSDAVNLSLPLHLLSQVHSTDMTEACEACNGTEADGLFTQHCDRILGIRIADCVPVFLFDPVTRAGAVIHAGRMGTFHSIVAKAVSTLQQHYQSNAADLRAVIGPSAGPCCYEVSEEMAREFEGHGGVAQGRHLDLWATNQQQLLQQGLLPKHIHISRACTICTDQFHSYRKNAPIARNVAILHIHPK